MSNYTVGYFVGSLSTSSINRLLAKALVRLAPAGLELKEISIKELPLYNRDSRRLTTLRWRRCSRTRSRPSTRCCS